MCDQLAWNLNREFGASAIHGDKKQQERDMVLAGFKVSALAPCQLLFMCADCCTAPAVHMLAQTAIHR